MESGVLKHTVACRATHTPVETHTHTGPGAIWHPVRIGRQKEVICVQLAVIILLSKSATAQLKLINVIAVQAAPF